MVSARPQYNMAISFHGAGAVSVEYGVAVWLCNMASVGASRYTHECSFHGVALLRPFGSG
jgi:hypothetical protein